jgi:hypothetical protein
MRQLFERYAFLLLGTFGSEELRKDTDTMTKL